MTDEIEKGAVLYESGYAYYWAYGSNLDVRNMKVRCPGAKKLRALTLEDGALVFRSVADVEARRGSKVHGGLWLITEEDEVKLDRYEGVASGFYEKRYLVLRVRGRKRLCLFYVMCSDGVAPPSQSYLETIEQGYKDFGLPLEALERAVMEAWGRKRLTPMERRRREGKDKGKPLARPKGNGQLIKRGEGR